MIITCTCGARIGPTAKHGMTQEQRYLLHKKSAWHRKAPHAKRLRKQGVSIPDIAKILGLSRQYVHGMLK